MSEYSKITVLRRPAGDGLLTEVKDDAKAYTYLAAAIHIAVKLLSTSAAYEGMTDIAMRVDATQADPWYGKFNGNRQRAMALVHDFVTQLKSTFPVVLIDEQHNNIDSLGYHHRGEWSDHFDIRMQFIHVNASRVRDMITASAINNHTGDFQTFQFLFANLFLHEVGGHLLVTLLGKGRLLTPPNIRPTISGYGTSNEIGESGRLLEQILFGGTIEIFRDLSRPSGQQDQQASRSQEVIINTKPGVPYLVDRLGTKFRIRRSHIIRIVAHQGYEIPYPLEPAAPNQSQLRSMGSLTPAGPRPADPTIRPMLARTTYHGYRIRTDSKSTIAQIPMNPRLRVQVVA